MEDLISTSIARQNFNMLLLTIFGAIALLLAAVGAYGIMSYSWSRPRTTSASARAGRESPHSVARAHGDEARRRPRGRRRRCRVAAAAMLYGVKPTDPQTYAMVTPRLARSRCSRAPARRCGGSRKCIETRTETSRCICCRRQMQREPFDRAAWECSCSRDRGPRGSSRPHACGPGTSAWSACSAGSRTDALEGIHIVNRPNVTELSVKTRRSRKGHVPSKEG